MQYKNIVIFSASFLFTPVALAEPTGVTFDADTAEAAPEASVGSVAELTDTAPEASVDDSMIETTESAPDVSVDDSVAESTEATPEGSVDESVAETTETAPDAPVDGSVAELTDTTPEASVDDSMTDTTGATPEASVDDSTADTTEATPDVFVDDSMTEAEAAPDTLVETETPSQRFTDNDNGTITDNQTGLVWLKNANCLGSAKNWHQAMIFVKALNTGTDVCRTEPRNITDDSAEGDWRLPTLTELQSLINYEFINPALPNTSGTDQWVENQPFSGVKMDYYWSSTPYAGRTDNAWGVGFSNGYVNASLKTDRYRVWPVRGGH